LFRRLRRHFFRCRLLRRLAGSGLDGLRLCRTAHPAGRAPVLAEEERALGGASPRQAGQHDELTIHAAFVPGQELVRRAGEVARVELAQQRRLAQAAGAEVEGEADERAELVVVQGHLDQALDVAPGVDEVAAQQQLGLRLRDPARIERARRRGVRRTAQPASAGRGDRVAPAYRPDAHGVEVGIDVDRARVAVRDALEALDQFDGVVGNVAQRCRHRGPSGSRDASHSRDAGGRGNPQLPAHASG